MGLGLSVAPGCSGFSQTSFERGQELATASLATPEGQGYEARFTEDFTRVAASILGACFATHKEAGLEPVQFVVCLRGDGTVKEAVPRPASGLTECVASAVSVERFPPPPGPGYWVLVELKFAP